MSSRARSSAAAGRDLRWLRALPRYRNTALRSLASRLRFFGSIMKCRAAGRDRPVFVVLVTNTRCNLSCRYCYGDYGARGSQREYTTAELIAIVDELWGLGTRNLTIHGGESLLREDLGELLNYVKWRGFYVSVNTNGWFVPQRADELACADSVCISLDGSREATDGNRGPGSWEAAIRAIDVLRERAIPASIHATLTRRNAGDMLYLAELAKTRGIRLQYSLLYNAGRLDPDEVLDDTEARIVVRRILALRREGYPVSYSEETLQAALRWPMDIQFRPYVAKTEAESEPEQRVTKGIECHHGRLKYVIDADGRVVTCWAHDDPDAGNVRELGVGRAMQLCEQRRRCQCCVYLSNNEHNLLLGLHPGTVGALLVGQLREVLSRIRRAPNKAAG